MKTKRVLSIIDLQTEFLYNLDSRVSGSIMSYVYTLLQTRKYDLIIDVAYGDELGNTTDIRLKKLLKSLPNVLYVSKCSNDGSEEILSAMYAKNIDFLQCKLEVVGVYTDACIRDTMEGLCNSVIGIHKNIYLHENGVADCGTINEQIESVRKLKYNFNINVI